MSDQLSLCKKVVKFMTKDGVGVITGQVMGIVYEHEGREVVKIWSGVQRDFRDAYEEWKDDHWGMDISHLYMHRVDVSDIICTLKDDVPENRVVIQQLMDAHEDLLPRFQHINLMREFS